MTELVSAAILAGYAVGLVLTARKIRACRDSMRRNRFASVEAAAEAKRQHEESRRCAEWATHAAALARAAKDEARSAAERAERAVAELKEIARDVLQTGDPDVIKLPPPTFRLLDVDLDD